MGRLGEEGSSQTGAFGVDFGETFWVVDRHVLFFCFFFVTQERANLNTALGQCQEHWHQAFLGLVTSCFFLVKLQCEEAPFPCFCVLYLM